MFSDAGGRIRTKPYFMGKSFSKTESLKQTCSVSDVSQILGPFKLLGNNSRPGTGFGFKQTLCHGMKSRRVLARQIVERASARVLVRKKPRGRSLNSASVEYLQVKIIMQKIFMWLERKYFLIALIQISILRQSSVLTSEINSFPFAAKRFDIYSSSYQIQTLIPNFLARHTSYECSKTRANADVPSAVPCSFNRSAATQVGAAKLDQFPKNSQAFKCRNDHNKISASNVA
ncbi:Hypothetical_protein [Hexamita inflata]|uniref:Hypothetical_protein n=1 Tax=Hexamita inflata TaxID=28002 RepID=A0AA86PZM0_9EUKA|nr:Hypothetical protein HINF_LOCUS35938 [Hexamita inflata]